MAALAEPRAYSEVVEFLANGATPAEILQFKPSPEAEARVRELLEKNREGTLTDAETAELDQYGHIEHLMRLVKARARQYLRK